MKNRELLNAIEEDCFVLENSKILSTPKCPSCRYRKLHRNMDKWECLCGWKKKDRPARMISFVCSCGRRMGPIAEHMILESVERICGWCAERRRMSGTKPSPRVQVRRENFCACGCDKLVTYTDFPETVPLAEVEWRSVYFWTPHNMRKAKTSRHWVPRLEKLAAMSYVPTTINNIGGSVTNISSVLQQTINQNSGPGGFWWGDGADGANTLVANVTLAALANIKNYTTLTLAGFTLQQNVGDLCIVIYCSSTLTSTAGGRIAALGTAGGAGGASTFGSGAGGAGGGCTWSTFVYAKAITGTGTIGGGNAGTNGSNGGSSTTGTFTGGAIGQAGAGINFLWKDRNITPTGSQSSAAGSTSGGAPAGGAGAAAPSLAAFGANVTQDPKDPLRFLFIGNLFDATSSGGNNTDDNRASNGQTSSGGASGAAIAVNQNLFAGGGAGGGGGNSIFGAGGTGGNGSTGTNGNAASTGAGAGGGGGGVSQTVMVCASITSTWTVSAAGGAGGSGGAGNGANGCGAAGGGGGGGGVNIGVAPVGSGATFTAASGAGGLHGIGSGDSTVAQDGAAGAAGLSRVLAY